MTMRREGAEIRFEAAAPGEAPEAVSAYLAKPSSGRGRAILVIHEDSGLTDSTRDTCDRLGRAGFTALAPDLLRGRTAEDRTEARQLAKEVGPERAAAVLDAGIRALLDQDSTEGAKVGALGFGLGGSLALATGIRNNRVGAVAGFYGVDPAIDLDCSNLEAPVLMICAGDDERASETAVSSLESELRRAGGQSSVQVIDGLRHGYMDAAQPDVFDAVAASEGWDALLAFFRAELA